MLRGPRRAGFLTWGPTPLEFLPSQSLNWKNLHSISITSPYPTQLGVCCFPRLCPS